MRLQDFLIGLMVFILSSLVVLTFVFDFYSTDNLNIDLNADNNTVTLSGMQTTMNAQQAKMDTTNQFLENQTPGESGATVKTGDISEGDLVRNTLVALTGVPTYLSIFNTMLNSMFSAVGLGQSGYIFFWFFTGAIMIYIISLLLSVALRQRL